MDAPQAPPPPDPVATANAQSAANIATATNQQYLNMVDQYTPWGSLTYTQNGTWGGGGGQTAGSGGASGSGSGNQFLDSVVSPSGISSGGGSAGSSSGGYTTAGGVPHFASHVTLSPEQQKLFDLQNQTQANLGQIGVSQSSKIGALLDTPFDIDAARGQKLSDIQKTFLDPQWNEAYDSKKTELFNSGIRPGTEAYDHAMRDFDTNKQRAYDQSYLDAYNTANQSALTERNQPINEITALLSGSQVSQPSFGSTPTAGVAPTDVIGAIGQSLGQQNVGYQGQLATNMGINSGLFGLGGAALGGLTSGGLQKGVKGMFS